MSSEPTSEPPPGAVVQPAGAPGAAGRRSPARFAVAAAMRRLGHALVAHELDRETLEAMGQQIEAFADLAESDPERPNALTAAGPKLFLDSAAPGVSPRSERFPDGLVSGRANPMGFGARVSRDDADAVLQVTLGAAFEGAPGRAHGGVVATLIDETMGMVLAIVGAPAYTARLTVNYRAPTPVGEPLEARARLVSRRGRKLVITGELRCASQLLADADALFLIVEPANFFPADLEGDGPPPR